MMHGSRRSVQLTSAPLGNKGIDALPLLLHQEHGQVEGIGEKRQGTLEGLLM